MGEFVIQKPLGFKPKSIGALPALQTSAVPREPSKYNRTRVTSAEERNLRRTRDLIMPSLTAPCAGHSPAPKPIQLPVRKPPPRPPKARDGPWEGSDEAQAVQ